MKKINWDITIGVGFIALAILLKVINLQYNASEFIQGFSTGLGLVLIIRGFPVWMKKDRKSTRLNSSH